MSWEVEKDDSTTIPPKAPAMCGVSHSVDRFTLSVSFTRLRAVSIACKTFLGWFVGAFPRRDVHPAGMEEDKPEKVIMTHMYEKSP